MRRSTVAPLDQAEQALLNRQGVQTEAEIKGRQDNIPAQELFNLLDQISCSRQEAFTLLSEPAFDPTYFDSMEGTSLLHRAAASFLPSVVEELLERLRDLPAEQSVERLDKYGRTPLHDALAAGRLNNAWILLQQGNANLYHQSYTGQSVLHTAAR